MLAVLEESHYSASRNADGRGLSRYGAGGRPVVKDSPPQARRIQQLDYCRGAPRITKECWKVLAAMAAFPVRLSQVEVPSQKIAHYRTGLVSVSSPEQSKLGSSVVCIWRINLPTN